MKTKTKLTVAIASVLSVVALAGTGYAGWVISKQVSKDTTGNVQVYDVVDHGVTRSDLKFEDGKNNIIWGKPADYTTKASDWLTPGDDVAVEYLHPVVTFTVENNDHTLTDAKYKPNVTAKIVVNDTNGGYANALNGGYIEGYAVDAKGITIDSKDIVVTQNADPDHGYQYNCSLTLSKFNWGSHFENNQNPYTYYNGKTLTTQDEIDHKFADAKTALEAIANLKGVTFKVTITASYNEAK